MGWETIECFAYGQLVTKTIKTFQATYRPAGGLIRVVIVEEDRETGELGNGTSTANMLALSRASDLLEWAAAADPYSYDLMV